MAELIGLIGTCVALAETASTLCLTARKYIHLDRTVTKELLTLAEKLKSYKGLIEMIKTQVELDGNDEKRLSALASIDGPLKTSQSAIEKLKHRLEKVQQEKLLRKVFLGKIIDDETASVLKSFDEALPILRLALDADQRLATFLLTSMVY
ncbi:hypothetical protein IWX90DRAFT_418808 [Phyllosticta citrichinensis]|uniref:Fungal N-terminal domain-containing protein n=1 Tax=Phyllosticta citrichinensis TaxID=1130410 RepID=A0ABR1XGD4_9PEZI